MVARNVNFFQHGLSSEATGSFIFSLFLTSEGSGLSTPAWRGGWAGWWAGVWRDCRPHLAATGTRLLQAATAVLAAVAGTLFTVLLRVHNSATVKVFWARCEYVIA
jgi:hypothetical protein